MFEFCRTFVIGALFSHGSVCGEGKLVSLHHYCIISVIQNQIRSLITLSLFCSQYVVHTEKHFPALCVFLRSAKA